MSHDKSHELAQTVQLSPTRVDVASTTLLRQDLELALRARLTQEHQTQTASHPKSTGKPLTVSDPCSPQNTPRCLWVTGVLCFTPSLSRLQALPPTQSQSLTLPHADPPASSTPTHRTGFQVLENSDVVKKYLLVSFLTCQASCMWW